MDLPGTVTLRPALAHEAPAMARMSRDLIEAGLGWRYTPSRITAMMRDPEHLALVACEADQVLGFALMQFGDEHAHLALLCVDPVRQRRGIGRRLTEWLVQSAEVAGIVTIRLELRADNSGALAFYQRLGFTEVQRVPGYYEQRIAARRMLLPLRGDDAAAR